MHVLVPVVVPPAPSPSATPSSPSSVVVNKLQFNNGNFHLTWSYLSATQEIEFEVRVKSTGYVALGLTKTNYGMQSLDLFIGGVNAFSKTAYLEVINSLFSVDICNKTVQRWQGIMT
jgi:hypothetical protein